MAPGTAGATLTESARAGIALCGHDAAGAFFCPAAKDFAMGVDISV